LHFSSNTSKVLKSDRFAGSQALIDLFPVRGSQ
jgi:hypothetical protein